GVTTAVIGTPASSALPPARPIARPDAGWLGQTAAHLDRNPSVSAHVVVTANPLVVERDGRFVIEPRLADDDPVHRLREASIRATPLVRAALTSARGPIEQHELTDRLADATQTDATGRARLRGLLDSLVREGFLISSATPSSTTGDGLGPLHALAAAARDTSCDALAQARDAVV